MLIDLIIAKQNCTTETRRCESWIHASDVLVITRNTHFSGVRVDIKLTCVYSRGSDEIAKYISTHVKIIKDKFLLPKIIVSRGGWFGSYIVFQGGTIVMLWNYIGESVSYWLEKGNSIDTWRRRFTTRAWRWRTTLIKSERCYWTTASLYWTYNTFRDCKRKQQERTMTFAVRY